MPTFMIFVCNFHVEFGFSPIFYDFRLQFLIQAYVFAIRGPSVYKRRECFRVNVSSLLVITLRSYVVFELDFEKLGLFDLLQNYSALHKEIWKTSSYRSTIERRRSNSSRLSQEL